MAQHLKDKLSRNLKNNLIWGGTVLLIIAGLTFVSLQRTQQNSELGSESESDSEAKFEDPQKIFEQTVPKPDSPVVAMLKEGNYAQLGEHFKKPASGETLPQVMFFYDTMMPAPEVQRKVVTELIKGYQARDKVPPKEAIVLSKVIGRSDLQKSERQAVEKFYKKKGWTNRSFWVEATVGWNPMPTTTIKALEGYAKSSLSHERNDFRYFFAKINDQKAQAQLKGLFDRNMKK